MEQLGGAAAPQTPPRACGGPMRLRRAHAPAAGLGGSWLKVGPILAGDSALRSLLPLLGVLCCFFLYTFLEEFPLSDTTGYKGGPTRARTHPLRVQSQHAADIKVKT